jgi:hypothetical protein
MAVAAATALGSMVSSFACVFTRPRGDVLPTWVVMRTMCAYAWTTVTIRTLSTDIVSPGHHVPRGDDETSGSLVRVSRGISRDRPVRWDASFPRLWATTFALLRPWHPKPHQHSPCWFPRRNSRSTAMGPRCIRGTHVVSLACTRRLHDHVPARCALRRQRLDTAQVPRERAAHLMYFPYPLAQRQSDAVI